MQCRQRFSPCRDRLLDGRQIHRITEEQGFGLFPDFVQYTVALLLSLHAGKAVSVAKLWLLVPVLSGRQQAQYMTVDADAAFESCRFVRKSSAQPAA